MRKRSLIAQQPIEEEKRNLLPLNINKRGKYDLDSLFNNTPVFDEAPMSFGKQALLFELGPSSSLLSPFILLYLIFYIINFIILKLKNYGEKYQRLFSILNPG